MVFFGVSSHFSGFKACVVVVKRERMSFDIVWDFAKVWSTCVDQKCLIQSAGVEIMVKIRPNQAENRHFMDIWRLHKPMDTSDLRCLLGPTWSPKNIIATPEHSQNKISTSKEKVFWAIFGLLEKPLWRAVNAIVQEYPQIKNFDFFLLALI